jgi:nucleoside-diphosphate-sugar epimerase
VRSDPGTILLTGATGLVGGELLRRLLARPGQEVVAIVRRPVPWRHPRLRLLFADLAIDELPPIPQDVETVIHCAASVAFDLPLEEQRAINVRGTQVLMEAATKLPWLRRFVHVSTAYVAGTTDGPFGAGDLVAGQSFRNTYEQSKHEAEQLVRASGLPFQIIRPSIVVGDSQSGRTAAFNVVYLPLRAYARGLISVVPGRPEAPVDLVPVDYVASGMLELLDVPRGGTHLLVAGDAAPTVADFAALAADAVGRPPAVIVTPEQIQEALAAADDTDRERAEAMLSSFSELLPYFDVRCQFHDAATAGFLAGRGVVAPPLADYLPRLVAFAEQARWGKVAVPDPRDALLQHDDQRAPQEARA